MTTEEKRLGIFLRVGIFVWFLYKNGGLVAMGCLISKPANGGYIEADGRQTRVRRLSQTVFDAEQISDEVVTIAVPIPVIATDNTGPVRQRRDRRASYIQFDSDPRSHIQDVASRSLAGAESGKTKRNQDAIVVHTDEDCCLFAVFDGHGQHGHHCSNFLKKSLFAQTKFNLLSDIKTADALLQALYDAEASMLASSFDCSMSGSTATIAMLQASRLIVAWVGDSPSYLITKATDSKHEIIEITEPHNFDNQKESERARLNGGRVMRWADDGDWLGPLRIFLPNVALPGLNMSRSLGDTTAHSIGVISTADVKTIDIDSNCRFLVLASDGVNEFLTKDEIMQITISAASVKQACDNIIQQSRSRWEVEENGTSDDISVIVVQFGIETPVLQAV